MLQGRYLLALFGVVYRCSEGVFGKAEAVTALAIFSGSSLRPLRGRCSSWEFVQLRLFMPAYLGRSRSVSCLLTIITAIERIGDMRYCFAIDRVNDVSSDEKCELNRASTVC